MDRTQLPQELRALVERVARHPHGLGFLHQAYLESVAVTLGVHPLVVDAARAFLETPEGRALLIDEVRRARSEPTSSPDPVPSPAPACTERAPAKGAQDLIDEVRARPNGIRFLLHAPPETIAVTYGVHPFVVFHAREIVKRERRARNESIVEKPRGRPGSP
ncbi:MAG: hypothetical protein GF328_09360 [Candidatus Latescibacteria bacterium]|nr:hypothetical protein [Candidatus Latescibacterota bacterium]